MGERNSGRLLATIALTVAFATLLGGTATAGERLTRSDAREAAAAKVGNGKLGDWKVKSCARKSATKFRCETVTVFDHGGGIVSGCRRTYAVWSVKGRIRVKQVKKQCGVTKPDRESTGPQTGPGPKFCPGTERTWDARTEIEGKTVEEAIPIAKSHGCSIRVVKIDGVGQMITDDFSFSRIDVAVEGSDQLITEVVGVF